MILLALLGACGDDPPKSYDNYQECFDDQFLDAMAPAIESIVTCCLDHPVDGMRPVCTSTVPDCINYLTANLDQISASPGEMRSGCEEYVSKLPMM